MCEFCTFGRGRMFNIYYQGGFCDFDKLDISMGKPYLTKIRKGPQNREHEGGRKQCLQVQGRMQWIAGNRS